MRIFHILLLSFGSYCDFHQKQKQTAAIVTEKQLFVIVFPWTIQIVKNNGGLREIYLLISFVIQI